MTQHPSPQEPAKIEPLAPPRIINVIGDVLVLHEIDADDGAAALHLPVEGMTAWQQLPDGGSRIICRNACGQTADEGYVDVRESPAMISQARLGALRNRNMLAVFGQFDAEQAIHAKMQQQANGVQVVKKPPLVTPN